MPNLDHVNYLFSLINLRSCQGLLYNAVSIPPSMPEHVVQADAVHLQQKVEVALALSHCGRDHSHPTTAR